MQLILFTKVERCSRAALDILLVRGLMKRRKVYIVYFSYLSTITHRYIIKRERKTILTFVAEEMYYRLIFPRA